MSEPTSFGHGEFIERIAAYLSGGLEGAECTAFENHRDACASCAAELERALEVDRTLAAMFADARPRGGFEDRIVKELRTSFIVKEPRAGHGPMSLPHPMVLKVASGVAAVILLGAVGFVGNSLMHPRAAREAAYSAVPPTSQPYAWAFDADVEADSYQKDPARWDEQGEGKYRGWTKERATKDEAPQHNAQGRGENEEWRRRSGIDATRQLGGAVNADDALRFKSDAAGEGKPQVGAGSGGPAGNGLVQFGEGQSDNSGNSFGFSKSSDATSLGLDGAVTSATSANTEMFALTLPANTSPVNIGAGATANFEAAPKDFGNGSTVNLGRLNVNGGTLNSRGVVTAGTGETLSYSGVVNQPKSPEGTMANGRGDTTLAGRNIVVTPPANRYYHPIALGSNATLGDALDKESKDLKDGVEKVAEADEKPKADTPIVGKPAERPSNKEYVTVFGKLNASDQQQLAQGGDSTGVADPQQGQPTPQTPQAQSQPQPSVQPAPQPAVAQRKIIRNGEMEFEVDSFDTSFLQISKIVTEEGGFVSSTNSEKLNNGKVRGTVVVRVPPERLDTLVLKLRALGDLKSQKISAQDVTKVYYDLESELKAARAMEERLLNIIKSGKGEIKDLLAAEKELGVYRGKIEKFEGEIRYYNNLVSFSTLSITSIERDIRKAAFASQTEQVNMGIENDDVEKARADALKAIDDAKGRVIESNLKKFDAGQLAATITADVAPDAAGPLIDRLRQLGRVARLDIERKQTTNDGSPAAAPQGLRVEKKDTRFSISMYNLANIAPRQTTNMNVAVPSVEDAYRAIIETVRTKNGRVVTSSLNRQKPEQTTAAISFEVPAADADATLTEIRRDREVMMLTVTENPDTNNVTAAKRGFSLQIFSMATVAPRETETLIVASRIRVADAFRNVLNELRKADARILQSQLSEQDKNNVGGILDFEVSRAKELDVRQALGTAGDLVSRAVTRSSDTDQTVDSKIRLQVRLISFDRLIPRETQSIEVASKDVAGAYHSLASAVNEVNGRVIRSELNVQEQNNVNGILEFELRREDREKFQKALESAGTLFSRAVNRAADNINTVESKIRMQVHLTHIDQLPAREKTKMLVEVAEVDKATSSLVSAIIAAGGRVIDTEQSKENSGQIRSHIVADVPLSKAGDVRAQVRSLGNDRINESSTNHQAPEGEVARAQFDVTLANADLIVGRDEGLGAAVKSALSTSVRGLLWSLQFIVIGLLIVGPWALMIWGGWRLWKRSRTTPAAA